MSSTVIRSVRQAPSSWLAGAEGLVAAGLRSTGGADVAPSSLDASPSSADPSDDYLLALAICERATLVSGDGDLLELGAALPIHSLGDFLRLLERQP